MTTEIHRIELSLITIDPDLQPRVKMNQDLITQYAEDMVAGIEFPPVRICRVTDRGGRYHLTSGFHRFYATDTVGLKTIACEMFEGTFADAKWDAAGTNVEWDEVTSGKKRNKDDKVNAVRMARDAAKSANRDASSTVIAKHVAIPVKTVQGYLQELNRSITSPRLSNGITDVNGVDKSPRFNPVQRPAELFDEDIEEWEEQPRYGFQVVEPEPPKPGKPMFNLTNEMVDWARWTWNPVTGCDHNCVYCYARDIANRFYPEKFTPTFRPERLEAPRNCRIPGEGMAERDTVKRLAWRNVFVCSMADLFGRWVPEEWIDKVFDSCGQSPEWNYLFLTKFPQRYVKLDFPKTAWVGTSVDEQKRVANAEKAFAKIDVPVKWLSVEPMLEPLKFNDLSMFHWVVIGGQSEASQVKQFCPDVRWVLDLTIAAMDAGCKVYWKPNISRLKGGLELKQYPDVFGGG